MMMCTRCKKRPAVVFVSGSTDAQQSQGYCLVCAKELGIKPVNDLMEKMGITEEMMESMESELSGLMSMDGAMMPTDDDDDENYDNCPHGRFLSFQKGPQFSCEPRWFVHYL